MTDQAFLDMLLPESGFMMLQRRARLSVVRDIDQLCVMRTEVSVKMLLDSRPGLKQD